MALLEVGFHAKALEKWSSMAVLLPEGKGPFPVLYLLHGLSDDHTAWLRRTSIERYVEGMGLIVVMPDGHRSWYVNDPRAGGHAYEDHIVKDVVGFVDRSFRTVPGRRGRAIAGLSMGGFGAVMLALRHPELFCAACSHSGALAAFHDGARHSEGLLALTSAVPPGKHDCFRLARRLKPPRRRPALRLDCGTEDFLLPGNRAFHAHLAKLGLPHVYEEYPGDHNWGYWDLHVQDTIRFVREHLVRE